MIILSYGKDTIRVCSGKWIYSYYSMNPYQIKKVQRFMNLGACGKAWQILRTYPFEREGTDGYLQRHMQAQAKVHVQAVP